MRIATFATLAALSFGMAIVYTGVALAVQDAPTDINGIETVCTGVGSAKDDPRWNSYPVKLVFATVSGEDLATEHVTVTKGGQAVMATECDAPWVLIKAPAGSYEVNATIQGQAGGSSANARFSTSGTGAQKTITLTFSSPRP
jgi:hypothetical protein